MQQLWARVLDVEPDSIGLDDSFFQLGGDSIAAMKLVGEDRRAGVQLTVANLFQHSELASPVRHHTRVVGDRVAERAPPFSLLSPIVKDAIFSAANPFNGIASMDNVADVLPASYMQELFITRGIRNPREAFNYFFLDLEAALDVQLLEHSCSMLLEHFPILHTHFVFLQEILCQVVLRHVDVPFHTFIVDGPLAEASHAIYMRDIDQISPLGLPTSFILVQNAPVASRLIICLSHAQYDGVCLPVMLRTLAYIYKQEPLHPNLGFPSYLAYVRDRRSISANYWCRLLEGSHITNITSKLCPKASKDTVLCPVKVDRVIRTP